MQAAIALAAGPICLLDAAALVGSLQLTAASLAGLPVAAFHDGTALPLAATIAGFAALAGLGYLLLGLGAPRWRTPGRRSR